MWIPVRLLPLTCHFSSRFGNTGGMIATYVFLPRDAPGYVPGYAVCLAFAGLTLLAATTYLIGVITANRQRSRTHDLGLTDYEATEKGDLSPRYRYML